MPVIDDVKRYLSEQGIEVWEFAEPTPTSETAAKAVGCTAAEIAKSILFMVGASPVIVVTSGDICPFLLPEEARVLVDVSMRRFPRVYAAAGNDHSAVPITVDQLLEITGGEEVDVCDLPENR
jgi:prolyl-tRNA editing enzyme YbaK/EbsC (Cys-tRNA(Pro) deacylase)